MDLKTVFIALLVGFGCAYLFAHKDAVFEKNLSICGEYERKIQEPEYILSYGERVKAIANGCL